MRGEDKAEVLRSLGVTPLVGTLDDEDVLFDATLLNDVCLCLFDDEKGDLPMHLQVIINTASVDAQTPVKAILRGLAARPASRPPAVFIHTSGSMLKISPLMHFPKGSLMHLARQPDFSRIAARESSRRLTSTVTSGAPSVPP